MSDANRPVPTQEENDKLKTGQMHPDEISNPGAEEKHQPEERAPTTTTTAVRRTTTTSSEPPASEQPKP